MGNMCQKTKIPQKREETKIPQKCEETKIPKKCEESETLDDSRWLDGLPFVEWRGDGEWRRVRVSLVQIKIIIYIYKKIQFIII
jgi:hypothetical protein